MKKQNSIEEANDNREHRIIASKLDCAWYFLYRYLEVIDCYVRRDNEFENLYFQLMDFLREKIEMPLNGDIKQIYIVAEQFVTPDKYNDK